jgi:hypothetical protein
MRRFVSSNWLGTPLILLLLTSGCRHNCCCCPAARTVVPAATMGAPVALPSETLAARKNPAVNAYAPSNDPQPIVVHSTAKPCLSALPAAPRESLPAFAHDANYRWLVGTVDYSRIQQAWVLRYVSIDQDDRYGGCVTLVAPKHEMKFRRGQHVRVEGGLIDPESRQLRPAYEVKTMRVEDS